MEGESGPEMLTPGLCGVPRCMWCATLTSKLLTLTAGTERVRYSASLYTLSFVIDSVVSTRITPKPVVIY